MRRVLLISFDFPPRGATGVLRITKFARYLPNFGWQPVVLTAAGESVVRDEALLSQLPSDLEVIRVADSLTPLRQRRAAVPQQQQDTAQEQPLQPAKFAVLRRQARRLVVPDPQIAWLPWAVRAASARLQQGDIEAILTTSPPHSMQLGGLWLKRRFPGIPWIMDMRDLWSDSGAVEGVLSYKLNRACERTCLRAADRVVVVTDTMRQRMINEHSLPSDRLVTITNGFDRHDVAPVAPIASTTSALQIVYVGTITGTRTPSVHGLLAAMERLAAQGVTSDMLVLRGYGLFDPDVHRWAASLTARGMVDLRPFVPHAQAIQAMAAADVCLLVISDDLEGRIAMPNKLYEYLAVGKPMLALTPPGDVPRLVELFDMGVAVSPSDINGIEAALKQLLAQHQAGRLPRLSSDDPRLQRFERRNLTQQLAALLDQATARHD